MKRYLSDECEVLAVERMGWGGRESPRGAGRRFRRELGPMRRERSLEGENRGRTGLVGLFFRTE